METSTNKKAKEIISTINTLNYNKMDIDKLLSYQQLINELSQPEIDFKKLPKYGCPSQFIEVEEACKGNKTTKDKQTCIKCWKDALTEQIFVEYGNNEEKETKNQTENSDDLDSEYSNYEEAFSEKVKSEGASYFSAAADAIQEQFSNKPQENKKKSFFKSNKNKENTKQNIQPKIIYKDSEFDKLKVLNLTPDQILELFEIMNWEIIQDYDDIKNAIYNVFHNL